MIDVNEINLDAIRSTITFLSENEEYGDDWSEEIATLDKVMDFCLEHGHRDEYGEDNVRAAGQAGTHSVQQPVIESGRTREQSDRNVEH